MLSRRKIKILWGTSDQPGSALFLKRFLDLSLPIDLKIAAFNREKDLLPRIDYTLDPVYDRLNECWWRDFHKLFGHKYRLTQNMDLYSSSIYYQAIQEFQPDLIISDGDYVAGLIACSLKIPYWNVNSDYIIHVLNWRHYSTKWSLSKKDNSIYTNYFDFTKQLPPSQKNFAYTPFRNYPLHFNYNYDTELITPYYHSVERDVVEGLKLAIISEDRPELKRLMKTFDPAIEITTGETDPYYLELLSRAEQVFCDGEACYLADVLYNRIEKICLYPKITDREQRLNSLLGYSLNKAIFLAEIERAEVTGMDLLERTNHQAVGVPVPEMTPYFLHQEIEEFANELCSF